MKNIKIHQINTVKYGIILKIMLEKIDVQVIYNDRYISTRIMPFKDEIRTNFHDAELSSIIIEVVVSVLNFLFFLR